MGDAPASVEEVAEATPSRANSANQRSSEFVEIDFASKINNSKALFSSEKQRS